MKLSKRLQQDHECGDFGKALEGYSHIALSLEKENEKLKAEIQQLRKQLAFGG